MKNTHTVKTLSNIPSDRQHQPSKKNHQYQITTYQYYHLKTWIEQSQKNYYKNQIQQINRNPSQYTTSAYVYSFKLIELNNSYISKNYRIINSLGVNGASLMIIANIFDEAKKCYITQSFQQKYIKCIFDETNNCIKLDQSFILSFYIEHHKNIMKFGMVLLINIQIMALDGQIFQLGTISHDLSSRPKHILRDHQLKKLSEVIGKIQFMIDCPQNRNFPLNLLIPPNRIISQQNLSIPPCTKISLHNKVTPFTVTDQTYPILLNDLKISIKSYSIFLQSLRKSSPFFIDFHYEDIKIEIVEYRVLLGYHNSWIFISSLADLYELRTNNKEIKNSPIKNKTKNKSPQSKNNSYTKTNNKNISKYYNMVVSSCEYDTQSIVLQPKSDKIALQYFNDKNGHLALVLQAKIKYTLNMTIKQQKTDIYNLAWYPIVFNLQDRQTKLQSIMIGKQLQLPGYPIQTAKNNQTQFCISYNIINDNDNLYKLIRKQNQKLLNYGSMSQINSLSDIGDNDQRNMGTITQKISQNLNKNIQERILENQEKRRSKKSKKMSFNTQSSLPVQGKLEEIRRMLKIFSINTNTHLVPTGTHIPIPSDQTNYFPAKYQVINKFIKIHLKFYGFLPHSQAIDSEQAIFTHEHKPHIISQNYYIPRTFLIQLFAFGSHISFLAQIDYSKTTIKYCVPIQMHCSKVVDHNNSHKLDHFNIDKDSIMIGQSTTQFDLNITLKTEREYNNFLQTPILCQIYDVQNYQFYASGEYPYACLLSEVINHGKQSYKQNNMISFDVNKKRKIDTSKQSQMGFNGQMQHMQTINSKKLLGTINQQINNSQIKNFKIQVRQRSSQKVQDEGLVGSLLFTAFAEIKEISSHDRQFTQGGIIEEVKVQKIAHQLSTKQRQMLRISHYNKFGGGHGNIIVDKNQIVTKYRQKNHKKYAQKLVKNQCHNDIVMRYQTGIPVYEWIDFVNTDTSGNDIFTFQINCQFMEIVVDNNQYNQYIAIEAGKQSSSLNKSIKQKKNPHLTFHHAQNNYGYYQGRIVYGEKYCILLKVNHQEWSQSITEILIVDMIIKRNKQPYKKYKIRLNYQQPTISHIQHICSLFKITEIGIEVKLPTQKLINKYSENIKSLTKNTSYSKKLKSLIIEQHGLNNKTRNILDSMGNQNQYTAEEDYLPAEGKIYDILIGFYWDKKHQNLMKNVLIRAQILSGEKAKIFLGQIYTFDIPYYSPSLPIHKRIYRIEASHNHLLYRNSINTDKKYRILTNNASDTNLQFQTAQPKVKICPLRPYQDQNLVISVINLEGQLLKKYVLNFSCRLPNVYQYQQIKLAGFKGQKSAFVIKNPYQIDYGFYFISSRPDLLSFSLIGSDNENIEGQKLPFKIAAKSQLKISIQVKVNLQSRTKNRNQQAHIFRQQYATLIDVDDHIIGIYKLIFMEKQSHRDSVRAMINQNNTNTIYRDQQLFSLFAPRPSETTI